MAIYESFPLNFSLAARNEKSVNIESTLGPGVSGTNENLEHVIELECNLDHFGAAADRFSYHGF